MIAVNRRVALHANDQIFFLHIPKTGGMSLKQILKTQVGEAQFRQIPIKKFGLANSRQLGGYRCLRAHWDYGFFRVLPRTPVYITLLREPVSRIVSLFAMIRRKTDSRWNTNDIHEFIERIGAERLQVHFLAGTISGRPIQGQALLKVALTRLWESHGLGSPTTFTDRSTSCARPLDGRRSRASRREPGRTR